MHNHFVIYTVNYIVNNYIFSFHHIIVFRITSFLFKIMYSWNSPPELKSWLKADKLYDSNHNLRSNGRELVVPAFSKSKFGDLRFRNIFANYVNFYKLYNLNMSFYDQKKQFFLKSKFLCKHILTLLLYYFITNNLLISLRNQCIVLLLILIDLK